MKRHGGYYKRAKEDMSFEMHVAGGLRQHRRELSIVVGLGKHGRNSSTGKKEQGILQHWLCGTRGNQYAPIKDLENIRLKKLEEGKLAIIESLRLPGYRSVA